MKKSMGIGAVIGLGAGIALALVGVSNPGASRSLQSIVDFFGSVPTYFVMTYNLSPPTGIIVFFTYWAVIGAIVGLLAGFPAKIRYILMAVFLICFVTGHGLIQAAMEREMQAIMDSLGQILKQVFAGR